MPDHSISIKWSKGGELYPFGVGYLGVYFLFVMAKRGAFYTYYDLWYCYNKYKSSCDVCNMKGTMMKRMKSMALVGLVMTSLCYSNVQARNDGFIAGACAIGAALFGVAGAVALVDWCCSETDDQLIARVSGEYSNIYSQYYDAMTYFGRISGMSNYVSAAYKPVGTISESVLYEFATYVWHQNSTQGSYRSNLVAVKNQLQSFVQALRKRIHALEGKSYKYEDQQRLRTMRKLLNDTEDLSLNITLFADCLDHHRSYFNLYDSIDTIRTRYIQEITIFESGRYSVPAEIKFYIVNSDSGQYAFRTFVNRVESDIATLKSDIRALAYNYDARRQYAKTLINYLVDIKNIVINDPRYQEELYQYEQARLQRLQIEALEAQARAERERVFAIHNQNMILNERNRIERDKLRQIQRCNPVHHGDVTISVTI